MLELPTIADLLVIAPISTLTILIVAAGWWVGSHSADKTIQALKEFIEYLKGKDRK